MKIEIIKKETKVITPVKIPFKDDTAKHDAIAITIDKAPIKLPLSNKKMIIMSTTQTVLKCPDCKKGVYFEQAPKDDYTHCTTKMIEWK